MWCGTRPMAFWHVPLFLDFQAPSSEMQWPGCSLRKGGRLSVHLSADWRPATLGNRPPLQPFPLDEM